LPRSPRRDDGTSPRAILLAFALLGLLAPVAFYILVWGGSADWYFAASAPSALPVALLFLLTALMSLRAFQRSGLTRREVLVIYAIVLVGVPLGYKAMLFFMLPKTAVYYYMARAYPVWETAFFQYLPAWWSPSDPAAIEGLFLGGVRVPWSQWWLPTIAWDSFMFCLWFSTFCILLLVQRQWISNERLTFPVAQIPLEVVKEHSGLSRGDRLAGAAALPRNRLFWAGAGIAFALMFLDSLKGYVPTVPALPMGHTTVFTSQKGIFAGSRTFEILLWPWLTALAYLVPKEISFSCWFLWALRVVASAIADALGFNTEGQTQQAVLPAAYQGMGAICALSLWVIWIGRRHLLHVSKVAVGWGWFPEEYRRDALLYRVALIGLLTSFGWMTCFLLMSGCRLTFSVIFLVMLVGYYVLWARLRAETGLGSQSTLPNELTWLMLEPVGGAVYRPQEIVTLFTMRWATFPVPDLTLGVNTGSALEAMKISDSAGINLPRLSVALVGGFLISLLVGSFVVMTGLYHYGFYGTAAGLSDSWPARYMREDGGMIFSQITDPMAPQTNNAVIAMLVGAGATVFLGVLRLRFWWWPLHPVGYVFAMAQDVGELVFPFVLGWALKSVIVRYGGLRLYSRTVPLAIGAVVGNMLNSAVWSLVGLARQATGLQ